MDLKKICQYISICEHTNQFEKQSVKVQLVESYDEWKDNPVIVEFVEKLFDESNVSNTIKNLEIWTTPINQRNWLRAYTQPSYYYPNPAPMDCTALYDMYDHYIYVESEVKGRWGNTYWISDNGLNTLESLPTIKAFKEFDFEVGKFYHLRCTDIIHWGDGKRKYIFDVIEECTEEDYLEKGYLARAEFNNYYYENYVVLVDDNETKKGGKTISKI